ncbi:hypothetical protein [Pseudochelatococcus contaminans]|uniref:Uncharacterized protein n=1 Tax=Pseudochelatococcus contaminans TaxID=1538103 RepID=A0A7W6EHN8_9HYPH|nr:hypothetical protein [Pseudochelatococcus contaminans]MBB3809917.1 hypothetical protein [Pseudochelatococcus contaminans]
MIHDSIVNLKASPIDRDPELATFIASRLGLQTISQIASECRENFGSQRAPSKSAIYRYWIRQRATNRRSARPSISP